ncbi:hypothetical protein BDK51DRAFT_50123, partial [Blyttiomyces helicus]
MDLLLHEDAQSPSDGHPPPPPRQDSADAGIPTVEVDASVKVFSDTEKDLASLPLPTNDPENAPARFDLAEFLENGVRARKEHGLTKQQLGLTFRDLTVVGEGADASSISSLLTPFEGLLNPSSWY